MGAFVAAYAKDSGAQMLGSMRCITAHREALGAASTGIHHTPKDSERKECVDRGQSVKVDGSGT